MYIYIYIYVYIYIYIHVVYIYIYMIRPHLFLVLFVVLRTTISCYMNRNSSQAL